MSILFRIAVPTDELNDPVARISARQLAAFRGYLRAEGDRLGQQLLEPDEYLGDSFEARVCPLALAAVTARFDHDPHVIAVVEEAQFRTRRVAVHRDRTAAETTMRVALTSDRGVELDLAYGNAYALLEALDIGADSVGDIPIDTARAKLEDPATRARARAARVDHYLPRLETLLMTATDPAEARLSWA
ncbi:hypothetical protein [Sphingobium sp. Cam5-1]|uniref:hypothetical protein n=1 Tax=Sphingobium sp. Cam5-1 TaxID=2789327 RepID=UPI0018AD2132|nr:hypothetical protein [Sphingobium sp. Cam5-1]QPI75506.1 hypothetical protein IZV00_18805 [Sphingobium sp. Cam5-1]